MRDRYRFRGLEREKDIRVYGFREREGGWVLEREREINMLLVRFLMIDTERFVVRHLNKERDWGQWIREREREREREIFERLKV